MKSFIKKVLKKIIFGKKIIKYYNNKDDEKLLNLKYEHLLYLSDNDLKLFKEIKNYIEQKNIERLKNKTQLKVGFILYTSSMWSCDSLYKLLLEDMKYDPYVIIGKAAGDTPQNSLKTYNSTLKYFKDNNYQVYDINNSNVEDINKFDLLFYMTPFDLDLPQLNIKKIKMNILTTYVSYSFMIASRDWKYNMPMYKLVWKFFADSIMYKDLVGKYCKTGNDNVVFCGYTKMDELINNEINDENIWKIPNTDKKVYKIIYAPHHSVFDEKAGFSTFDLNYKFILELAKKYSDCTSWIIKPHPQLGGRIVKNGFFNDISDYNNYLNEWDNLPNAKVITDGTYFDLFKTSDTMILDSVSFLVEYQYVHKPLLFLTRNTQKFNEFGDKVKEVLYNVDGSDFDGIEKYLKEVIFNNDDTMKKDREEFFEKYLDYVKYNNGKNASESIYQFLNKSILDEVDNNERE